jgi:hypothetical protein
MLQGESAWLNRTWTLTEGAVDTRSSLQEPPRLVPDYIGVTLCGSHMSVPEGS